MENIRVPEYLLLYHHVDTDGNGILNLIDIIKMADMLSAFSEKPQDISTVDINSDGRFSLLDMLTLAYYIVGLAE